MNRRFVFAAIVILGGMGGCFESHTNVQELRGTDCVLCHSDDYDATAMPIHSAPTVGFPTTCADCHRTTDWYPALGGLHPSPNTFRNATNLNDTFLIDKSSANPNQHKNIPCLSCHDLDTPRPPDPVPRGWDTNCIGCHPNDAHLQDAHRGVTPANGTTYQYRADVPNFCLSCHPQGTAEGHPTSVFPLRGEHNRGCASCHDRATGPDTAGANTNCTQSGCHPNEDRHHGEVGKYSADKAGPWPRPDLNARNFCRMCHRSGGGGD